MLKRNSVLCLFKHGTAGTRNLVLVKSENTSGWPKKGDLRNFLIVFTKSPYLLPCISHRSIFFWLNSPCIMVFSSWKRFIIMVNFIICCAKEVRASIVLDWLNECNLSCKSVKNCKIIGLNRAKQILWGMSLLCSYNWVPPRSKWI